MPSASKPSASSSASRCRARSSHRATVVAATATPRSSRSQRVSWATVAPARRRASSSVAWRSSLDRRCPMCVPPERGMRLANQSCFRKNFAADSPSLSDVLVFSAAPRGMETTSAVASSDSVPGSPPFRPLGRGRDWSRRCRWLSRCVAALDALPHPVHVAFVTVAHGRLEAPMDRIGCLLLWACGPNGVLPGPPGSTSRDSTRGRHGWPPAALSQDRCVALAGREPCGRPHRSLPSVGTSPWPTGNQVWPVGVALAGCPRFALARMSPRRRPLSPPVRFVSHGTCRVFTRRSRVRVPRFWRRRAAPLLKLGPWGPTLPLRSELAGSGWGLSGKTAAFGNA